jgi:hypothetical protein
MRRNSLSLALAGLVALLAPTVASAQSEASSAELAAARRELAATKIEARLYSQEEYRCQKRELDAAIRVSDEEVRTMQEQLRRFGPFHAFAYGQQPSFEYRNARLCLADAQARRRSLIDERNDLVHSYNDRLALLNLNVSAARARLVELSGGGVIELDVVKSVRALPAPASSPSAP